jgi:putative spermidine/putrescine transport system permease protein
VRASAALFRRPWLRATLLLSGPGAWFVLVYLLALVVLFVSAFWRVDDFTGALVRAWNLDNLRTLVEEPTYRTIALRTIGIAAAVTVTDALLALPFAFFAARLASPRLRGVLFVLVLLPLWTSYLVRVYAWRLILAKNGVLNWTLAHVGLGSLNVAYSNWAMWIVFSYIWLPFMILPVWAAFERVPDSYLEASADLGARGATTFRRVALPLAAGGLAAGSALAWARGLGEFGATIMFAGSLQDVTQTLPLAIYAQLARDFDVALAIGGFLVVVSAAILVTVKALPSWRRFGSIWPIRSAPSTSS